MTRKWMLLLALAIVPPTVSSSWAQGPSYQIRSAVLKSVVHVSASFCVDGTERGGSGFAFGDSAHIITAHHVVGGCTNILVRYDGAPPGVDHLEKANISKVFAAGDLVMLDVDHPPVVPALNLAPGAPDHNEMYAGFGYQNGQPTASDEDVTLATGSDSLSDLLPQSAINQLIHRSMIDLDGHVLRINTALQPGMSGGPIVDASGRVIGIVAGGLRAGAAPASWGWPANSISRLLASSEPNNQPVQVSSLFYSATDIDDQGTAQNSGRTIHCGTRTFTYSGREKFAVLKETTDDSARVEQILRASLQPEHAFDDMEFDLWTDFASGATAVVPASYTIASEDGVCVVRSQSGPFQEVIWSADASDPSAIQQAAVAFENTVMVPRVPQFIAQPDLVLSTIQPQTRDNGMVFNRKAYLHEKAPRVPGMPAPTEVVHSFETLIAKSGSFLGVGTINSDLPLNLGACVQYNNMLPGCSANSLNYLREWTRFILATQLSTYPAT